MCKLRRKAAVSPPGCRLKITVLYNRDFDQQNPQADPGFAARAEIEGVAEAIAAGLRSQGHEARLLPARGQQFHFVSRLLEDPPDLVFNQCESLGADARGELAVPAILDSLGIPYTGSPAVALALALHKHKARDLLRGVGVPVPEGVVVRRVEELDGLSLPFPLMVKPAREDASVGISRHSVVHDEAQLLRQVAHVIENHRQEVVIERFIEGREIYVALLGNEPPQVLPFTEIDFSALPSDRPRIVTYEAKWESGSVEDLGTAPRLVEVEDEELRRRIEAVAREAFRALELRDYGRIDLRVEPDGTPWVIDVNANCALAPDAGYARAAAAAGLPYDALVGRIAEIARARIHADSHWQGERSVAPRRPALPHRELHGRGGRVRKGAPRASRRRRT